jgi:N-methylhydantoinase B
MRAGEWGKALLPAGVPERIPLPEGSLLVDYVAGGGGFGDPIDRDPQAVLRDIGRGWTSVETAKRIYGVILTSGETSVDVAATEALRNEIRGARKKSGQPISGRTSNVSIPANGGWRQLLRFHAALEICTDGRRKTIRCRRCGHLFCGANENYKLYALHRVAHLSEVMPPLPSGEPYIGEYHLYTCPGCAAQLQVDMYSPPLGGEAVLWDTRIDAEKLKSAAH